MVGGLPHNNQLINNDNLLLNNKLSLTFDNSCDSL